MHAEPLLDGTGGSGVVTAHVGAVRTESCLRLRDRTCLRRGLLRTLSLISSVSFFLFSPCFSCSTNTFVATHGAVSTSKTLDFAGATRIFLRDDSEVYGGAALRSFRRIGHFFRRKTHFFRPTRPMRPSRTSASSPEDRDVEVFSVSAYPLAARQDGRTPFDVLDDASRFDPYAVLRIPFLSGPRKIREAYRAQSKEHHPDLHRGDESLEWMMIQRAYRILTDGEERVRYDSARITRNALSATEGFVAFGIAAAQQMGSVLSDASEAAGNAVQRLAGFGRFLAKESQAWAEQGLEALEELQAEEDQVEQAVEQDVEIVETRAVEVAPQTPTPTRQAGEDEVDEVEEEATTADRFQRIQDLKQARRDLEAEANA